MVLVVGSFVSDTRHHAMLLHWIALLRYHVRVHHIGLLHTHLTRVHHLLHWHAIVGHSVRHSLHLLHYKRPYFDVINTINLL